MSEWLCFRTRIDMFLTDDLLGILQDMFGADHGNRDALCNQQPHEVNIYDSGFDSLSLALRSKHLAANIFEKGII